MDNSTTTGVIYALSCDCDSEAVRYVGLTTKSAEQRLKQHLVDARNGGKDPKHRWIRKHVGLGHTIQTRILEIAPRDVLGKVEQCWIDSMTLVGHRLLNCDSRAWTPMAEETRRKISAGNSVPRPKHDPERTAKIKAANKAYWSTLEARTRSREITQAWREANPEIVKAQADALASKSRLAVHTRLHVNRNIIKDDCKFCQEVKINGG